MTFKKSSAAEHVKAELKIRIGPFSNLGDS